MDEKNGAIMIVDDTPAVISVVRAVLESEGYLVSVVKSGEEAIKQVAFSRPDLILLDSLMSGMDGYETCRRLKSDKKSSGIPVIFMSALHGTSDKVKGFESGAVDYITKPIETAEVLARVHTHVSINRLKKDLQGANATLEEKVDARTKALRESEEQCRQMAENIHEVFWMSDLKSERLLYVSPAYEDIWQCPLKDLYKKPLKWTESIHQDDITFVKANWEKQFQGDSTYEEFRITLPDGSVKWIANRAYPIKDKNGGVVRMTGIAEDITERRKMIEEKEILESQLRQAQKLEAIGTLAGGIAHVFNNILSGVMGYTELCLGKVEKATSPYKYLQEVRKAGLRAKDLIRQILAFRRQAERELKPVQINLIIKEAIDLLRASLPATVEIKQNTKSDSLVMADPTQIYQILMTLCTNAAHAMQEKGGILGVELTNVALDSDFAARHHDITPGPHLQLNVSDTGHGMTREVLDRIFDPFVTTKKKGEGAGMGLSVVHGIVKSHGGAIYAYSEPGQGATFKVFLPTIERSLEPETRAEKPIVGGTERILFIDDEMTLVDTGKRLLESLGYEVTSKTSSIEALELFRNYSDKFDLVISDVTMPNMTGDELAGELIAVRPDIPIILCTGFSTRTTEEEAERMGIRAYLLKPIMKKDLAETIRRVLGKHLGISYTYEDQQPGDEARAEKMVSGGQSANLVKIRDITDRKQAEEALRESEEKYRNLINNVPVGLFWSRVKDGKLVECNENFAQLIGYKNREECIDEVVGAGNYVDPSVRKQMLTEIKNKGEINNFEAKFTRRDGTQFWVSYSIRIYPEKDILEGAAIDITERKVADQALRASEEKYRTLLNNDALPISFWAFHGTEWHIVLLNAVAAWSLGGTQEELVGKTFDEIFPDSAAADIFKQRFTSIYKSGIGDRFEEIIELKTGEMRWFRSDVQPVKEPGGSVISMQVLSEDITEHKRAEEELRHLRNYLSNIIDSMPSILIGVDKEGNVTQWNVEAQRTTGLLPEEAVGQPLVQAFPRLASEIARVRVAMQSREVLSVAKQACQESGEMRYEDVTVYPLIANGIEGAVIRIDDVTDKVRIEEMMIQSEKMLSVGGLAAGMAHEINNPLAGIMQNVQVMKNRMSGELSKNIAAAKECGISIEAIETYMEKRGMYEMIDLVMESGKRAAKIVNNMLNFSRKSDESFALHSLCDLLDKTIELAENDYDLKKKIDFRKIELVEKYDKATPQVMCEGSKIQQVFLNILKNGAQAMAKENNRTSDDRQLKTEGESEISVPKFTLRVMPDGEMARIEIEDNGPGMDEETRKRVFEPFFTTKDIGVGTGLGLSVSYFIVTENHGGTMEVESAPGKGAKFMIRLPFERNV